MPRKPTTPKVPGKAAPAAPAANPTFEQLQSLGIDKIARVEMNLVIDSQDDLDALDDDKRGQLFAHYARFKAAPPDPTAKEIEEGADQVIDAKMAAEKGEVADAVDPTKIDRAVLTKDGWVCPASKSMLKA